ncbi:MAG: hypothetical protein ACTSP4_13560 [Candidatus Hodarchaeales archaeon]
MESILQAILRKNRDEGYYEKESVTVNQLNAFEKTIANYFNIQVVGIGQTGLKIIEELTGLDYRAGYMNVDPSHPEKVVPSITGDFVFIVFSPDDPREKTVALQLIKLVKGEGIWLIPVCPLAIPLGSEKCHQNLVDITNACKTVTIVQSGSEGQSFRIKMLARAIGGIIELVNRLPAINLDLGDLMNTFGTGGMAIVQLIEEVNDESGVGNSLTSAVNDMLAGQYLTDKASRALVLVAGGSDLQLQTAWQASQIVAGMIDKAAELTWGMSFDNELDGLLRVTVVLSGE